MLLCHSRGLQTEMQVVGQACIGWAASVGRILAFPLPYQPSGVCMLRQVMVTKNRLPLVYDKSRPARFGVIPKRPKSGKEVRWFELDPGQHPFTHL